MSINHAVSFCVALSFLFLKEGTVFAQCQVPDSKQILNSTPQNTPSFGRSVATDGEHLIVGANEAATIYKLVEGQWVEEALLLPGVIGGNFAYSVAIEGDIAVVGAPQEGEGNQGFIHIYRNGESGWMLEKSIQTVDEYSVYLHNHFGSSVAISGNTIIVGSPNEYSPFQFFQGAVYLYAFDGDDWLLQGIFNGPKDSQFGASVAIQGEHAFVSEITFGSGGSFGPGKVHVYRYGKSFNEQLWFEEAVLTPENEPGYLFGYSLAAKGNSLVIGAPLPPQTCSGSDQCVLGSRGKAYLFQYEDDGWTQKAKFQMPLLCSDMGPTDADGFAASVGIQGEYLFVGAPGFGATENGAVFVYQELEAGWKSRGWLEPSSSISAGTANFAKAISASGDLLILGVPGANLAYSLNLENDLCPLGDLNGDSLVSGADLGLLLGNWGPVNNCSKTISDLDQNGIVDAADLGLLLAGWTP